MGPDLEDAGQDVCESRWVCEVLLYGKSCDRTYPGGLLSILDYVAEFRLFSFKANWTV